MRVVIDELVGGVVLLAVFGVDLARLLQCNSKEIGRTVPRVLSLTTDLLSQKCTKALRSLFGMDVFFNEVVIACRVRGIFRESGSTLEIEQMKVALDLGITSLPLVSISIQEG